MESPSTIGDAKTELPPPPRKLKRAGRIWARALLALVFLLAALIGVWFLGVRPYLHHQALMQVDRAWTRAESETLQYLSIFPDRQRKNLLISETLISNALNTDDNDSVQNWQMTVTPANIHLSFTACGQNCTVTTVLEVSNTGQIQVTHVQVQGMFALIMSDAELTNDLNSNLQRFNFAVTEDTVTKITLLEHAIDIQLY
jgi:hypothetical protein